MNQQLHSKYIDQVKLLIDIIPMMAHDHRFAIKGGTAINLFLMDVPRLSVDIDLCYLPLTPRDQALYEIGELISHLSHRMTRMGLKTRTKKTAEECESTLFVQSRTTEVKVEINLVVRGAVEQPVLMQLSPAAQKRFERNVQIMCLSINDLFGGKICASLDRQHPRDFFDLTMYFKHHAYTRDLHQAFMVYLLSSKRPISEFIWPNRLDIKETYEKQFKGMTTLDIDCATLEQTREKIFSLIPASLTDQDKEFLMSFKEGTPKWDLFPVKHVQEFPAIQWKLFNIRAITSKKRRESLKKLEQKLYASKF